MAITSVGQTNSAFYTDEGVDPSQAGSFLSFNPNTNTYEYSSYEKMIESTTEDFVKNTSSSAPSTIGDVMKFGSSAGTSSLTEAVSPAVGKQGSVHQAALGFNTALSIKDVLQTASMADPLSLGLTGYGLYSDTVTGLQRTEILDRAAAPTATIADMLAAYEQAPSWTDYAKNALGIGLNAVTGNVPGLIGAGLNLASTISAEAQAAGALESAGAMERQAAATGATMTGGFGFVNTAANFADQQAKNLAAASTETRTPTSVTIADVLAGASVSTSFSQNRTGGFDTVTASRNEAGDVVSRTDFGGGGSMSQNVSENQRTQERRDQEGYTGSSAADRRGDTGRDGGSSGSSSGSAGQGSSLGGDSGGQVGGDSGWGR
jgi:hypothetical protein